MAGWIVFSMTLAGGIGAAERQMFFYFVAHNSLDAEVAKSACLPTSLVREDDSPAGIWAAATADVPRRGVHGVGLDSSMVPYE